MTRAKVIGASAAAGILYSLSKSWQRALARWLAGFEERFTSIQAEIRSLHSAARYRTGLRRVQVLVRDNNVDQALKALKKKLQREGVFREMKLRGHFEKPSVKKAREKAEAVRRARKLARKRAQREGLVLGRSGRR